MLLLYSFTYEDARENVRNLQLIKFIIINNAYGRQHLQESSGLYTDYRYWG